MDGGGNRGLAKGKEKKRKQNKRDEPRQDKIECGEDFPAFLSMEIVSALIRATRDIKSYFI